MADFLFAVTPCVAQQTLVDAMVTTKRARVTSGRVGELAYAVSRVDDPVLWAPALSEVSSTTVFFGGRIALDIHDWEAAERLPHKGGLAARHLLEQWLGTDKRQSPLFNGAAVVVVLDAHKRRGILLTDRMGFAPAFATTGGGPLIVGSHTDAIAALSARLGAPLEEDQTTIAEFICTGTATHPNTLFKNLVQLDAGSEYAFELQAPTNLEKTNIYWRPPVLDGAPAAPRHVFVEALTEGLRTAGRLRSSARLETPVVLLSAGSDSRAVLFSLRDPSVAQTFTYYDEFNPELERASKLSKIAGARHKALRRPPEYYVEHAAETVRLSGGMWSIESGHHSGFIEDLWAASDLGTVLTGCYADYLLKGLALNVVSRKFLDRNLPLARLATFAYGFHVPYTPLSHSFRMSTDTRLAERFDDAFASGDRHRVEALRISPMCREADASGRLALWRQVPIDPIMADSNILDAYGMQSIADKLSGLAFGEAVARVVGPKAAVVPNNNYGAPVGTSAAGRVAAFAISSARRKIERRIRPPHAFETSPIATYGSWPNFGPILKQSDAARVQFEKLRCNACIEMVSEERHGWSFDTFVDRDRVQLMRLLTVSIWNEVRNIDAPVKAPSSGTAAEADILSGTMHGHQR